MAKTVFKNIGVSVFVDVSGVKFSTISCSGAAWELLHLACEKHMQRFVDDGRTVAT